MLKTGILIFCIFLLFGLEAQIQAQDQSTITGQVTDSSGELLPGVNILVMGTTSGTSTSADGSYELQVANLQGVLVFSYIGFQTKEIPIDGRTEINIELESQTFSEGELVVVGYGTRARETLTGSVSAISGDQLQKVPVTNLSNSLGGQLPGVVTVTDSGEPGSDGSSIRIRGNHTLNNNNPLIVIDGVPNRSGGLDRLNPRDIENISVLKDASAAIYGAQAANGVILVTTKRGIEGQAPQFNINVNQGFSQPTRIPDMADAPTYMTMLNEIDIYEGNEPRYSEERIQNHGDPTSDPWLYPNTDWLSEVFKPMSFQTRADMSIAGGSDNINYYLSLGGLTEDGFYENSATKYNQYNFRSNIDARITNNIDVRFDVSGRLEDRNLPTVATGTLFQELMRSKPNETAYWPSGHPGPALQLGQNPVVAGTSVTGYDKDERYYLQSNLALNVEIPWIDGLGIRASVAYDKDFRQQKRWQTPWTLYSFDRDAYIAGGGDGEQYLSANQSPGEPQLTQRNEDNYDIMMNLVAEYQVNFENHSVGLLIGTERQTFRNSFFSAFRRNYTSQQIDQLFAGGEELRDNDGSAGEGARLNFFSRINYDFQNKYLLELVGRYDGSYIFPEEGRFGFFPAISVGWRLTQENWFQDITSLFDELKLRASWGQTGNDRIDEWQYLDTFGFGSGYVFGIDNELNSLSQLRLSNPNVSWEVANQFDIGVDAELLNSRLILELDYFDYLRSDILHFRNASVPQSSGLSLPRENIGEVSSWGYDGSITWRDQVNTDFNYSITLNAGYATNKINYWDEPPGAPEWQRSTGSKMNTNLYYNVIGVFRDWDQIEEYPSWPGARPGDLIFEDVNGDGAITADDRIRINKNRTPDWTGGLNISGAFKQFDFNVFFQGAAGGVQYVSTMSGDIGNYLADFAEKRWTPDNPDAEGPRAYNREAEYWSPMGNLNTYFLRETDYIRLKTFEVGYNLSSSLSSQLGLQQMRVYANGFNLLTWDRFGLMDPEASHPGGHYYPQKRVVNVGLSVTF